MGPNDWDVGTLVRLGVLFQSWAQMIGTLVRWCGWGFGTHNKNIERRQRAKDRICRKCRGGIGMYPYIYIYIYIYTYVYRHYYLFVY